MQLQHMPLQIPLAIVVYLSFKKWEPTSFVAIFTLLAVTPLLSLWYLPGDPVPDPQFLRLTVLSHFSAFYAVILVCVLTYRLTPLHPLSRYPGPILCKSSKLLGMFISTKGKLHLYDKELRDKYGPIVRVGPNELSITEKNLIPYILGNKGMPKGPMWDGRRNRQLGKDKPYLSLIDVRDAKIHAQLRKRWNDAFAADPLKDYRALLVERAQQLCEHLQRLCSEGTHGTATIDLAQWISFFSFDLMGDLAFGGSFELMQDQDTQGIRHQVEIGLIHASIIQHAPWVANIYQSIPFLSSGMRQFARFAAGEAKKRISAVPKCKDLFYHLYEANADPSDTATYESQLASAISDSILTIVAGSDTSSTVLSCAVALLLCHSDDLRRLTQELETAFPILDSDHQRLIEVEKLSHLRYLNAVINETLRLFPPVPTAIQRAPEKGSGGKLLGDTGIYLPEGTAVYVPPYSLHRDPRYFSPHPNTFIPDRWLSPKDISAQGVPVQYITDRDAFIPFSFGPANCVGKPLALTELRYVMALLVLNFQFSFSNTTGVPKSLAEQEAAWAGSMDDRFGFMTGELRIDICTRDKVSGNDGDCHDVYGCK